MFRSILFCVSLTAALFPAFHLRAAQTVHVDARSSHADADESREKPFSTLDAARQAVRNLPKTEAVEVVVAEGTYFVGETPLSFGTADSGTAEHPILWRGAEGKTILSGGQRIDAKLFAPVTDAAVLPRLDAGGKDSILVVDLTAAGIPPTAPIPDRTDMPLPVPELFFGNERMTIARWPNDGWATVKTILDGGSDVNNASLQSAANPSTIKPDAPIGGIFEYDDESNENRPARWVGAPAVRLHGYWCFDWSSEVIRVGKIDPEAKTISLSTQHIYGLRQGNPSPRRWMAVNLLEELDQPGEYSYDSESNRIYFWPPTEIGAEPISVAAADRPVVSLKGTSNFCLFGFTVTDSFASGIDVQDGDSVQIDRCTVRNTRQRGITVRGGMNHSVTRSLIEETGAGGLSMSGGDRKTLTPCRFLIENNLIRRFSVHRPCYANGIGMYGVGLTARRNEISDAPHQAIGMGTNDSVFEYNIVHHVCLTGDDCGALYKGRNPSMRGNVIRYNFWHDIGSPRGHGCAAIYFDDGDGGEKVIGNIFLRAGDPGKGSFGTIFSHGGHDNLAENNIFIDCKRPLGSAPWNDPTWKDFLVGELWQKSLLKDVDITAPPYTERYPELIGFMEGAPAEERRNHASKNLFIRAELPASGNWELDETNRSADDDRGFVNGAENDFTLKPDAEVFQKIPGFQPIDFNRIGPEKRD